MVVCDQNRLQKTPVVQSEHMQIEGMGIFPTSLSTVRTHTLQANITAPRQYPVTELDYKSIRVDNKRRDGSSFEIARAPVFISVTLM